MELRGRIDGVEWGDGTADGVWVGGDSECKRCQWGWTGLKDMIGKDGSFDSCGFTKVKQERVRMKEGKKGRKTQRRRTWEKWVR